MDKKNTTIGVLLLAAAFTLIYFGPKSTPTTRPETAQPAAAGTQAPASTAATAGTTPSPEGTPAAPAPSAPTGEFAQVNLLNRDEKLIPLANDFIEARLTNYGGAVREVALKKHALIKGRPERYVVNSVHEDPILALTEFPGLGNDKAYELVRSSATEVVYRTTLENRIEVTRRFSLTKEGEPGHDPHRLHHETTFRNLTDATAPLGRAGLSVGTAALVNSADTGQHLNIVTLDGDDVHFLERGELEGGGIGSLVGSGNPPKQVLELGGQIVWAAAKNQFFTSIYTPENPGTGIVVRRVNLTDHARFPDSPQQLNIGLSGAARFELPALAPKGTAKLAGLLYVGPQEYNRLRKFSKHEDRGLPYTQYFFNKIFLSGYVAPLLNLLMNWMQGFVGNWGVAIILMTLTLKIISLPFTLAASRSAKRMSKLQPLIQEVREKYKDNPQKQQQATMEIFKTHKVNPVGGCVPVLITMPLFVGFFAMLQCPAELRFQSFLWAPDLSAPDTVWRIPGIGLPLNIMPLLMGATMYFQMRLTPTPSVDNMQIKMMRFMPVIFTAICYGFSCALSLYSTINGLFTIGQQIVINRMKDKDEVGPAGAGTAAAATVASWKKGVKNVTPSKKKK